MNKKIGISILAAAALVASLLVIPRLFNETETVYAYGFRDGYSISPTASDGTGVGVDSAFLLEAEDAEEVLDIAGVEADISITPEIAYRLEAHDQGVLIVPEAPLDFNSIYTLYYKGISFAYQTESDFQLLGTLPRNETTNVPITTGIEFYMSHEGADVEDVFEIEPSVRGSFEVHGNVVVFVPRGGLDEKTIYTVTIKEGMTLQGSDKTIGQSYSFSFETGTKDDTAFPEQKGYFSFNRMLNDFAPGEVIQLPASYSFYNDNVDRTVEMGIYRYESADEIAAAIEKYNEMPVWSWYGGESFYAETKGLDKVDSLKLEMADSYSYPQLISTGSALPEGFYLIDCTWEDLRFQTFVQVTNLSYAYLEDEASAYFWIHDLGSGNPVSGASVESKGMKAAVSDDRGIAMIGKQENEDEALTTVYQLAGGGDEALAVTTRWQIYRYGLYGSGSDYWRYMLTDRGLYQPDDTVSFFGYLKPRYSNENIDEVTVVLSQGSWFFYESMPFDFPQEPLDQVSVNVENGFYEGNITLPNLEPGYYNMNVKIGDRIVSSQSINVDKYVKPDYEMTVTKDKEAIFVNEPVVFTIDTSFFEGTPVPGLDVNYNFSGLSFKEGRGTTGAEGSVEATFVPAYQAGSQGIVNGWFSAYASLPESGQISGNDYVRIFVNDMDVQVDAESKDGKGAVEVTVHGITLDRLNDGTAEDGEDYLAEPVVNRTLSGKVMRNEWVRTESGEYYDFINKEVRKQYSYNLEKTVFDTFRITTDEEGRGSYSLDLPEEENVYYEAVLNTADMSGRSMTFERYFGRDYGYYPGEGNFFELRTDKDSYHLGEQMNFSWSGNIGDMNADSYLFAAAQNGIRELTVTQKPSWTKTFADEDVPNIEVLSVAFNGKTYVFSSTVFARMDIEERRMNLELTTDKDSYRPGERITINIEADAKDARVNLSLVDEALFALQDQQVDTLASLYEWVSGGILQTGSSHNNQGSNMFYSGFGRGMAEMATTEESAAADSSMAPTETGSNVKGMGDVQVRSEFKDTALFATVTLDSEGKGSYTFTLPDNITSWRLTAAGISKNLEAGTGLAQIPVSMPFFINTTVNTTYLTGDRPQLGVTAYGQELTAGETVTYEVTSEEAGFSTTVTGRAFERTLIPLWTMEKGQATITVKAIAESGLSDGLEEKILVVDTYHETMQTQLYELVKGLRLAAGSEGMATITFLDKGQAQYLPALYSLSYGEGRRLDQKAVAEAARRILEERFGQPVETEEIDISEFMMPDGGLAILPYGISDLAMTALFTDMVDDPVDVMKLKAYLTNAYYSGSEKSIALYGLTRLGEPMLREMNLQLQVENRSFTDTLYLALAYEAVGDSYMAKKLYDEVIAPEVESYELTARIGRDNGEETIQRTSLAMLLTARLGMDEADGFYQYSMSHTSKEKLTSLERLLTIRTFLEDSNAGSLKVVYSYNGTETAVDTASSGAYSRTVPSSMLNTLEIISVEGDGMLAVTREMPLVALFSNDPNIRATRVYESYQSGKTGTYFESGDIVKVVLDVDIDDAAIDSYYRIVDYAPSGIVPLTGYSSWGIDEGRGWFREVEGQKVTFYQGSDWRNQVPLYYYARIISPGTFKGDGILIQGTQFNDSLWIGKPSGIEIR